MMDMHASSSFLIPCMAGGKALPGGLRQALEFLSGLDMSDVRVHYHSPWPERFGAQAFAFGSEIHLGPQAEAALAHEAWHVVQQKQGRVVANGSVAGFDLNDEESLEQESDFVGALGQALAQHCWPVRNQRSLQHSGVCRPVLQRTLTIGVECFNNRTETEQTNFLAALRKELVEKFKDPAAFPFPTKTLAEILADLHKENAVFSDWSTCLQEIAIRNVGYQVEDAMRLLMMENTVVMLEKELEYTEQMHAASTQRINNFDAGIENSQAIYEDRIASIKRQAKDCDGYLKWINASYFTRAKDREMGAWVLGRRDKLPSNMNCWEALLFSLVMSGLVDKSYIAWANYTLSGKPAWMAEDAGSPCTQFIDAVVKNAEKSWCAGKELLKLQEAQEELPLWIKKGMVRLDPAFVIPRGRVIFLNFSAHVVISTGENALIESPEARKIFGSNIGHGILELDKADDHGSPFRTIRETTIEDLYEMGPTFLKHVLYAPFPNIFSARKIDITENVPLASLTDVKQASQTFLEQNESKIKKEIDSRVRENNKMIAKYQEIIEAINASNDPPELKEKRAAMAKQAIQKLQGANESNESKIRLSWSQRSMKSNLVREVSGKYGAQKSGTVSLPVTFSWEAVDLYHGLVKLRDGKN